MIINTDGAYLPYLDTWVVIENFASRDGKKHGR